MSNATTHIETEKQFTPELRFKEFEGDWNKIQLKEICSFFSGGTPTSTNKEFYNGDIPFIGSGNIFDSNVTNYITEEALNSSSAKIVEVGDLLYALYGANSGEVGISKMSGAVNQAILCIRTESEKLEFIHCLLVLNKDKIVAKYLQGGQGNLSANIVKKLKYHFPSLLEQQKIASFLSAVDEKIQQLTKKKALLEVYKKGVMQQLFSGQLRFKDENGKDYPDWEEKRIGDLTNVNTGGTPRTMKQEYWGGNIRWMNSGELNLKVVFEVKNRITKEGLKNSATKLIPKKCILIGLAGQGKTRGTAAINMVELCTNQSIASILPNYDRFIPEYLFQNIDQRYSELRGLSTGDGGRGGLNLQIIKSFKVPLPSVKEQQKIANYLSGIDTKIEAVNTQITQTQTFKKGLLQQMFD
jgi:type I restriction enzyme S subunit